MYMYVSIHIWYGNYAYAILMLDFTYIIYMYICTNEKISSNALTFNVNVEAQSNTNCTNVLKMFAFAFTFFFGSVSLGAFFFLTRLVFSLVQLLSLCSHSYEAPLSSKMFD